MSEKKKASLGNTSKTSSPSATTSSSASSDDKTPGGGQSTRLRTDVVLPQTKVKVIMKSSPEIDFIGADSVFLITKATELFIDHLSTTAIKGSKSLNYKQLSDLVHKHQNMEFLRDIIPIKLPARVALAELAKHTAAENKELLE